MVKQVLIVTYKNGKTKRFHRDLYSDLFDLRTKMEEKADVIDTELQYDLGGKKYGL